MPERGSLYEAVGGMAFFERLVDRFYRGVEADPALLRVYPRPDDLDPARRRLTLFLAQYWGGPSLYGEERGHPRLRMRHAPFEIGAGERDAWLHHMREAVRSLEASEDVERALLQYFETAADGLRNQA